MKKLIAKSHVIELKKGKYYIFVFNSNAIEREDVQKLFEKLKKHGVKGVGLMLYDKKDVVVYEKSL